MSAETDAIHFRDSVERRIPGHIRVIQALMYLSVAIFAMLGSMWGFIWLAPALGTLFGAWYFTGVVRITYEYQLEGTRLTVRRLSGMRFKPRNEEFLTLELKQLAVAADEGAEQLAAAERISLAASPKRVTYDVSAHNPNLGCAVAYAMGVDGESGRWLKVYFQPAAELLSYMRQICPGKVFIHASGE